MRFFVLALNMHFDISVCVRPFVRAFIFSLGACVRAWLFSACVSFHLFVGLCVRVSLLICVFSLASVRVSRSLESIGLIEFSFIITFSF